MAQGTVYQRKKTWWIKYHVNGRAFYESSGSKSKDDAQQLLRKRMGDIDQGLPVNPQIRKLTFDEAAQYVVDDYERNGKRSLDKIKERIRLHLKPFFEGRRLTAITLPEINRYIAQRQAAEAANASINRELAIIKRAFRLARKAGEVTFIPEIEMLAEDNVRTGFFERNQFEAVRALLAEPLRPMVTLAYVTGWRINSEVLPLQWRQVDFGAATLRLEPGTTKNKKGRTFVMTTELRAVLEAQRTHTDAVQRQRGMVVPWVFHRRGERIKDFRHAWLTACRKAGVPGRVPHDFRRTAVRNLVRAGVSEKIAMTMTGHKTRSVFDRYDIVDEQDLAEAAHKLDAATVTLSLHLPYTQGQAASNGSAK
jgi:integrase